MAGRSNESKARTTSSPKKANSSHSSSRSTTGASSRSTSARSKKTSASTSADYGVTPAEHARLSKPFDRSTHAKARAIAAQYRLVIERDGDDFVGSSIEMPLVMGGGDSIESCAADTIEALTAAIATILERGETPPAPAREGKRDIQLNVRLTAMERSRLETAAGREGFRSISDFVRTAALDRSR